MCQGLGPKEHDEISEIDRTRIAFNVVPSDGLSLLIGRDFLSSLGIRLDCGRGTLRRKGSTSELTTSRAGHFGLHLRPDLWSIPS